MGYRQSLIDRMRPLIMDRALAYGLSDEAPEWWGELHDEASIRLSSQWQRIRDITDRPEVIRDFLSIGLIVAKAQHKNRGEICLYRLAKRGDRLHNSAEVHHATTLSDA